MSWQSYVDDHLMVELQNGGTMEAAAIAGKDGGLWAQSADFPAATTEQLALLGEAIATEPTPDTLLASGIWLGSRKFLLVRHQPDELSLLGKQGEGGVIIKASSSALVIGIFSEKDHAVPAKAVVEKMADYLTESGY